MPFPVSMKLEGLRAGQREEVLALLEVALHHAGARRLRGGSDRSTFTVPLHTTSALGLADSGRYSVQEYNEASSKITVEVSYTRSAVALAVLLPVFFGIFAPGGIGDWNSTEDIATFVLLVTIGFLWMHGGAYVISRFRVARALGLEP